MEIQVLPLIIVVAYLVGMLIVGFVVGKLKIKNSKDYMVAGRRMGLFMVAFSLSANNIGGGCTTGLAQKAFGNWGMSAIWYVLTASIAMIPLAYFAPKIRKTLAVTIPEVVGRRFGKLSSNFTAILSVLSLFCLTSSQIAASGGVINALIPSIPLNVCLVFAGIVIILYTTLGGMIADQISDLVQFIIILVGLAIATPIVLKSAGGWQAISAKLPGEKLNFTQIGWASIIGYIFNYFCTFLAGPEMVSRFETAKDEKTARNASLLSAVLMAAMAVFPTLLGLAAFALKDELPNLAANGSNAMVAVTGAYAPGIVTGIISAAIICATMSSADSNLLCMSTMIINDLYKGLGGKKDLSEKRRVHRDHEHLRLRHPLRRSLRGLRSRPGGAQGHQELRPDLHPDRYRRLHPLADPVQRRHPLVHDARGLRLPGVRHHLLRGQLDRVGLRRQARPLRLPDRRGRGCRPGQGSQGHVITPSTPAKGGLRLSFLIENQGPARYTSDIIQRKRQVCSTSSF